MSIPVIFTTIEREKLAIETFNNILEYGFIPVLGIQTQKKTKDIITKKYAKIALPYDCGLSYSRNYLVEFVQKYYNSEFVIVSADSIQFENTKGLSMCIEFLTSGIDLIGFDIKNRIAWEGNIDLIEGKHFLIEKMPLKETNFYSCEIVRNFFIAKTRSLLDVKWDNELKLAEHEDFFYRFKLAKKKVMWTNTVVGKYINHKPQKYNVLRQRMYDEFVKKLKDKWNISGWVRIKKD